MNFMIVVEIKILLKLITMISVVVKATQIYLIVLRIFLSTGAVGEKKKKKSQIKRCFIFLDWSTIQKASFPGLEQIRTSTYCIIPNKRTSLPPFFR